MLDLDTMKFTYDYPMPAVAADIVLFNIPEYNLAYLRPNGAYGTKHIKVLLITRKDNGKLALPGGYMEIDEQTKDTAVRELEEEAGIYGMSLVPVGVFDAVDRDPRGRIISVAYTGITYGDCKVKAGDDAKEAEWFYYDQLPVDKIGFDHVEIIKKALPAVNYALDTHQWEMDQGRVKFYV